MSTKKYNELNAFHQFQNVHHVGYSTFHVTIVTLTIVLTNVNNFDLCILCRNYEEKKNIHVMHQGVGH